MFVGIGVGVGRQRFAGGFADSYSSRVLADGGTIESLSCVANASTLLQQASLLFIPSGYKAGVAYSALPNNGNGDLTWSRNSTANRTLANGNIGSVGANVPRLSYMYGSCPSALLEPQRTNLSLYSEQFENASWLKNGSSITANSTNAPNSTLTADSLIEDTTTGLHFIQAVIAVNTNTTYTGTIYVKANTRTKGRFRLNDMGGQPATDGNFDLSAETISAGTITNVGGGWFRLSLSRLMGSTSGSIVLFLGDNSGSISYTGNGTNGLYIWGAQLEVGAYATTYIPTTNASATRIADVFTRNNIYTNGVISASGGTWYVELKNNVAYLRDLPERFGVGDTSSLDINSIYIGAGTASLRAVIWKAVSGSFSLLYTLPTDNVKIAIKWNGTSADIFANGVKVVSATAFTTTNMQFLARQLSGIPLFVQAMALYNTPLSDANCITLTT